MTNYAFDAVLVSRAEIAALLSVFGTQGGQAVDTLLAATGLASPVGVRSLMWLWKFDLLQIRPG